MKVHRRSIAKKVDIDECHAMNHSEEHHRGGGEMGLGTSNSPKKAKKRKQSTEGDEEREEMTSDRHNKGKTSTGNNDSHIPAPKKRPYVAIALPGSILDNAQSPELRTYLAGQIARGAAVHCVDEVIVFDENSKIPQKTLDALAAGDWSILEQHARDNGYFSTLQMSHILQYLESPQYLRKALFPKNKMLQYAGLLNPLDLPHHMRADDYRIPYREGIVVDKPVKAGRGSLCDVGLDKDVRLDRDLTPGTRVTVKLDYAYESKKHYRGHLVDPHEPHDVLGLYWGYHVRMAASLNEVLQGSEDGPGYDFIIGTSERGRPIRQLHLPENLEDKRVLIVFGGLDGLEAAMESDEAITTSKPRNLFHFYLNSVPDQGTRTIRTEEAIPITLAALHPLFNAAN